MIRFDANNNVEKFTYVLSKRDYTHLGNIVSLSSPEIVTNENSADEISFTLYKDKMVESEIKNKIWESTVDFQLVYVKELDIYFSISVSISDDDQLIKSVVGTSLCENELSQTYIYGLEINTETDISREEYVNPTVFYKPDSPSESLLHRTLSFAPHYSIGHVDESLWNIQRTFSEDGNDIYSFLTETVANEIKCIFKFDSTSRTVNVYDLQTVCLDCDYRGDFSDKCPECGSNNIKYYGKDTLIYVDSENLAEGIDFETDVDSVKNCFKLEAGDDNMTAAVVNLNPNGSRYLYYFSEDAKSLMSDDLRNKIESYNKLVDSKKEEYSEIISQIYDSIDKILYYTSEMMPTIEHEETDAKKEAAKLTEKNLSPIGLVTVSHTTSTQTVNSALKTYAKVFVNSGKYKIEINEGEFTYTGYDQLQFNHGSWTGNFRLTNWGDEEDSAISETITVEVYDNYKDFIDQKIKKQLKDEDDEDGSIFDVLSINDLALFKQALTYYCLDRLKSFYDAIQSIIDILIEENQAKVSAIGYEEFYLSYKNKLTACQLEMDLRSSQIKEYEDIKATAEKAKTEIQNELDFEKYLGIDLYKEFYSHRREDTYSNSNFISDGLDNKELFERAQEFIDLAEEEIFKSGEKQHSIECSMQSLLAMNDFAPLREDFALSNFIRVGLDDVNYRLRLISCSYSWDEDNIFSSDVTFSDLTKVKNGLSDTENILDQASSMASSFDSVSHQVDMSKEATDLVDQWVTKGLDLTNMQIVSSADNQNFVQDKHGLLIRSYDDILEDYSPEQMRLVNSTLAITNDAWDTISVAIGKYIYKDPTNNENKYVYGIMGDQIVGRLLLGESLGIYSDDEHMSMEFDNRGLILNARKGADNQYTNIFDIQVDGESVLYIDRNGKLVINNSINQDLDEELGSIKEQISNITVDVNGFKSEVSKTYSTKEETSQAKQDAITTASNDATNKANQAKDEAITSANASTDEKLLSYSTTEETKSLIQQTADSINLEVSKKYTTLEQVQNTITGALTDYVTTSDMSSAIQQSADSINLSVSKTYSTKSETTQAKSEAITAASADASNKANQAKNDAIATANASTDEKLKSYYTSEEVDTAIKLGVGTIDLSVYYTKTETTTVVNKAKNEAISTASSDATTKANSAKNEAITEAASDATTKANKAKQDAISDTDQKLQSYSTTTEMNAAIKLSADGITSTVSKTYATKDSVTGKVDKSSVISSINQTAEEIKISASKISLEGVITANNNFKILSDGSMEALNGKFSGVVNASTIEASTISGGFITGSTINGGSISGSTIVTDNDVTVGNNLYVGDQTGSRYQYIYFTPNTYIRRMTLGSIEALRMTSKTVAQVWGGSINGVGDFSALEVLANTAYLTAGYNGNSTGFFHVYKDNIQSSHSITISSDKRLKSNIKSIDISALIDNLDVYSFNYNYSDNQLDSIGVIAQDFVGTPYEKYILRQNKEGYYSVDYNAILMALVQKVQELERKLEEK